MGRGCRASGEAAPKHSARDGVMRECSDQRSGLTKRANSLDWRITQPRSQLKAETAQPGLGEKLQAEDVLRGHQQKHHAREALDVECQLLEGGVEAAVCVIQEILLTRGSSMG